MCLYIWNCALNFKFRLCISPTCYNLDFFLKGYPYFLQNFNQPAVKRCTYSGCVLRKYLHKKIPQSCFFLWVILQQIENIVYCKKNPHRVVCSSLVKISYIATNIHIELFLLLGIVDKKWKYFICKKYPHRVVCSSGYYWQIVGDGKAATFILLVTDEMTMTMITIIIMTWNDYNGWVWHMQYLDWTTKGLCS